MKTIYDSYCGLYCGACPILLANERGEVEKRAAEGGVEPEVLICSGCKSETIAVFCTDCEMRQCARDRGLDSCRECDEYPRQMLKNFRADEHSRHSAVLKNLESMHETGLDAWLEEQKARWSCPACGARFTWYDALCPECGAETYDCRAEELDL